MDQDSLWNTFVTTGSVDDYLNYAKNRDAMLNKGEKPYGFGENQGTNSPSNKTE